MLTSTEQKLVLSTLTKRRAWLKKNLESESTDAKARDENLEILKTLDSAMRKIAASAPSHISEKPTPKTSLASSKSPQKSRSMESATFLVAEDNEDSANLMMDILQDIGAKNAILAKDGGQAFDHIKKAKQPFDIILCDWDMPVLSGIEVYQKAKASNTLKGAHFMMVTAVSEAARIREAVEKGVNDYIVKPVDIDVLEMKIKAALGIETKSAK